MQLKEAGFEAKPARTEDVDLVALLQQHVGDLPQVIVDALPATPTPDPRQEGKEAGDVLRSSVGKLRDLGQRKLRLQEEIDTAKDNLRAMLHKMQDIQNAIEEAKVEVAKTTKEYEDKVVKHCAEEVNNGVESVLQALGMQEASLTEEQKRKLEALKSDEAKRRRMQVDPGLPPGLPPSQASVMQHEAEAEPRQGEQWGARPRVWHRRRVRELGSGLVGRWGFWIPGITCSPRTCPRRPSPRQPVSFPLVKILSPCPRRFANPLPKQMSSVLAVVRSAGVRPGRTRVTPFSRLGMVSRLQFCVGCAEDGPPMNVPWCLRVRVAWWSFQHTPGHQDMRFCVACVRVSPSRRSGIQDWGRFRLERNVYQQKIPHQFQFL